MPMLCSKKETKMSKLIIWYPRKDLPHKPLFRLKALDFIQGFAYLLDGVLTVLSLGYLSTYFAGAISEKKLRLATTYRTERQCSKIKKT